MARDAYAYALDALNDRQWAAGSNGEANALARAQAHATLALVDELRRTRERNTVDLAPVFDEDGAS